MKTSTPFNYTAGQNRESMKVRISHVVQWLKDQLAFVWPGFASQVHYQPVVWPRTWSLCFDLWKRDNDNPYFTHKKIHLNCFLWVPTECVSDSYQKRGDKQIYW